jgi:energy-converting hydrogenase Eha subunit A
VVLGVMAALGLVVVVPSLSVEYGVLRAFQQSLLFVAPVMAAGMWTLLKLFGKRASMLAVVLPVGVLLVLSGVASTVLGGHQARLALANSGLYYDRYIAADSDVTSMAWLSTAEDADPEMPKVIAGRNYVLPAVTAGLTPDDVVDRIYPTLLTKGSYVFVDARMATTHRSTIFYSGDRISYRYPMSDLDRLLDLVYSSGRSRIYR